MTLDEVVTLLRPLVKLSNVKGQYHIDLTLAPAEQLDLYKKALIMARVLVEEKMVTQEELNLKLGL